MKVKTILIYLFLFASFQTVKSQIFISDKKVWNVYTCNFSNCYSEIYKLTTDTTINNIEYKKVHLTTLNIDSSLYYEEIIGYVREDTTNKVYIKYNNSSDELLIYDFKINPGDTMNLSCMGEDILDSISVSQINDNSLKRTFHFNNNSRIWIEGIGDLSNPFYYLECRFDMEHRLICFSESDTLKYYNSDFINANNTCNFAPLKTRTIEKQAIKAMFKDNKLTFLMPESKNINKIYITDVLGNAIKYTQVIANVFQLHNDNTKFLCFKVLLSDNTIMNGKIVTE